MVSIEKLTLNSLVVEIQLRDKIMMALKRYLDVESAKRCWT